jgi:prepilin-type N-terminal cleavage/methylation domain-containing protein/prepilin-type processing-associated H-X9-DG protein
MGSLKGARRGFTLVELLAVIAIIAVLSAILFPVFSIARANARRVRCESNMRQVGAALLLYADDYHGYLPSFSQSHPSWMSAPPDPQKNSPQPGVVTWDMSIQERLRNVEVLTCPDNPFGRDKRAYAMAAYSMKQDLNTLTFLGERVENIANRSEVVLLFEKGQNLPGSWGDAMGENVRQSHASEWPTVQPGYSEAMFHRGGKNFLFLDGHVQWAKADTGPFLNKPAAADPLQKPGSCFVPGRRNDGGEWEWQDYSTP